MADLDRLLRHAARLGADVLPLPAGGLGFVRTGELPHHDHGHVEGVDDEPALMPRTRIYRMDDDLHPRDQGPPGSPRR
jgi:hypothetical protein